MIYKDIHRIIILRYKLPAGFYVEAEEKKEYKENFYELYFGHEEYGIKIHMTGNHFRKFTDIGDYIDAVAESYIELYQREYMD